MDFHEIDLNLLVAFDALFKEHHVTRAGRRIGLSQPAMSAALTRLRRLTRDELFVRTPEGMQPTPRAQELAEPIGQALERIAAALNLKPSFDPALSERTFTLGLTDDGSAVLLPGLLTRVAREAPGISVRVRRVWAKSLIEALDAGAIDLGVGAVGSVPARILKEPLRQERFVSVLRRGQPEAARFDLDAFLRLPHLLVHVEGDPIGVIDRVLAERGLKRRVAVTVPGFLEALSVVAGTSLLATLPERIVRTSAFADQLDVLDPPLPVPGFTVAQYWHRRADGSAAHLWLRQTMLAVAAGS